MNGQITNGEATRILFRSIMKCRENLGNHERMAASLRQQISELILMHDHLASLPGSNFLTKGTPPTTDPDFAKCGHPPDQVKEGPRIPLVYGTAATEVCEACGGYRQTRCPGGWEPGPPDTTKGEDL